MSNARLTPNRMFDFAFQYIASSSKEVKIAPLEHKTETQYAAAFYYPKQSIFLLHPVTDFPKIEMGRNENTQLLPETLAWIKQIQSDRDAHSKTFIVPLAESQADRRHWCVLVIQNQNAYFYDPKTNLHHYSLKPLANVLEQHGFTLHKKYVGWQSVLDNTYCGYFCAAMMKLITQAVLNKTFPDCSFAKTPKIGTLLNDFYNPNEDFAIKYSHFITPSIREKRSESNDPASFKDDDLNFDNDIDGLEDTIPMIRQKARQELLATIQQHIDLLKTQNQSQKAAELTRLHDSFAALDLDNYTEIQSFRDSYLKPAALNPKHVFNQFSSPLGFLGACVKHQLKPNGVTDTVTKTRELTVVISDFLEKFGLQYDYLSLKMR